MNNKLNVSWKQFDLIMEQLARDVKNSTVKPKYIYGISRGGLVPAVTLSHKLGGIPVTFNPGEDFVLFIDDISDEGKSLTYYSTLSRCYTTATLFVKKGTEFVPDFYVNEVDRDVWVCFPWELEDEPMKRTAKLKEFKEIRNRR